MSNLEKAKEAIQKEFDEAVISAIKTTLSIKQEILSRVEIDNSKIKELDERLAELDTATPESHYVSEDAFNGKPTVMNKKDSKQFPIVAPHNKYR